jgi:hypothetical protein
MPFVERPTRKRHRARWRPGNKAPLTLTAKAADDIQIPPSLSNITHLKTRLGKHGCKLTNSANRPSTKARKPVSALPPEMRIVFIWPRFASVACTLLSHRLVVGKHPQNTLVGSVVHGSGLHRQGAAPSPLEPRSQFFYTTRRAVPSVAHGGLIGDASAFAATEKPDAVIGIASIEDAR